MALQAMNFKWLYVCNVYVYELPNPPQMVLICLILLLEGIAGA